MNWTRSWLSLSGSDWFSFSRRGSVDWTFFLPARRIRDGLCAESATAGHGFLDSGIVLCVFAWKTLRRFELSGFAASYGYETPPFSFSKLSGQAR